MPLELFTVYCSGHRKTFCLRQPVQKSEGRLDGIDVAKRKGVSLQTIWPKDRGTLIKYTGALLDIKGWSLLKYKWQ